MIFDLRTIFFTGTFFFAVCTIILIQHQSRSRISGIGFLAADFVMQTAATLLIAFRHMIPDWMSIAVAMNMVMSGSVLGYMGMERIVGKVSSQTCNFCLLAVFGFIFIYFVCIPTDVVFRILAITAGTSMIWFQCAWLMLVRVKLNVRSFTFWVGIVFVLYCIVNIVRIATLIGHPPIGADYFNSGIMSMVVILSYQVLFLFFTFGLVFIFNERLMIEIGEEREKFSKAFHFSSQAILLCRISDGRIVEVNRQFETLSGYPCTEAVGKTGDDLQLWACSEDRTTAMEELNAKGHIRGQECRFESRTGDRRTGILHVEILEIGGRPFALVCVDDITCRKQAEESLERLNRTLQERVNEEIDKRLLHERLLVNQSRLASAGMMIGAITHQWRQPLSTLDVIIQRFCAVGSLQKLSRKQLDEFKNSAMQMIRYMSETVEEFRTFHQPEKQPTAYNPCACIVSAVNLFSPQFRADGITLDYTADVNDSCGALFGYPNELKQVIVNLISNARYAILDRRAVEGAAVEGRIAVRVYLSGENTLTIDVEDNGCGIPEEIVSSLFDPYFSTRQPDAGTGIGLYLSRGIVEGTLKGRIYPVPGHGPGAIFRIELLLDIRE
jgi:PAS domain S-box-containing protein